MTPKYSAVDFIETYTGRSFFPLHPDPTAISIIDIAHGLSNQCRYSGHTRTFYSTAQHCCLLTQYTAEVLHGNALDCLQILMHDAPEAYLVDIPRPVKQHMPEYRMWDHEINDAVRAWLGISDIAMPPYQDEIDSRIIVDERAHLFSDSGLDWGVHQQERPLGIRINPWSSQVAEQQFLMAYAMYSHAVYGGHQYLNEIYNAVPRLRAEIVASDDRYVEDLIEVDLRGGVGRVKLRDATGMLERDPEAGTFPRPAWRWVHGQFTLVEAS